MKTEGSPLKKWLPAVINSAWTRRKATFFPARHRSRASAGKHAGRTRIFRFVCHAGRRKGRGCGVRPADTGTDCGRVWQDDDYDGVLSESENGLRGAAITLLDGDGAEIAQTQTARSGEFTFDQLMPGAYSVRITLPEGYVYTAGGAGSMAERTDEATVTLDLGELHMGETLGGHNGWRAETCVSRRRGLVRFGRQTAVDRSATSACRARRFG